MDETKTWESTYSGERTKVTGPDSLRSSFEPGKSSESEKTAASPETAQPANKTSTGDAPGASKALPGAVQTSTVLPGTMPLSGAGVVADFVEFLKRTKRVWLIAAGAIFAVMALVTVQKRMAEQARIARATRQEHAVTTITVDALLARCGQPAEDVTKDMYPILVRTMSYQSRENEKIVFEFSRTAEEKSDWVFLSMKDASGASRFDTPEAKIAALPCLDTKK